MTDQTKAPIVTQAVTLTVKVLTSDGRTHELEVTQDNMDQQPLVNYMGNNILVDKQLQNLLQAIHRSNHSLI